MCVALKLAILICMVIKYQLNSFYFHSVYPCDDALYRDVLSRIPEECCTIPLIMNAILEQVQVTTENRIFDI